MSSHAMTALSIAPMMDRTDRHFRYFLRRMTQRTLLYTEMVTTGALRFGDRPRHLDFHCDEHPIALQLGGDDPSHLAECARWAMEWGYDEVNLNVGCPSDRVQRGRFGACLMKEPKVVAEALQAMQEAVSIPVTVKHRIGVDELDQYEDMLNFVTTVASVGVTRFSVHARKAWLKGLSPKENRDIPPLRYEEVYRLKKECPELDIEINGGIKNIESVREHLTYVDAVMIGRAAYENPYLFATVDQDIFGESGAIPTRSEVALSMRDYIENHLASGGRLSNVSRHMLTLFVGVPGARIWRRTLSEGAIHGRGDFSLIEEALDKVMRAQAQVA